MAAVDEELLGRSTPRAAMPTSGQGGAQNARMGLRDWKGIPRCRSSRGSRPSHRTKAWHRSAYPRKTRGSRKIPRFSVAPAGLAAGRPWQPLEDVEGHRNGALSAAEKEDVPATAEQHLPAPGIFGIRWRGRPQAQYRTTIHGGLMHRRINTPLPTPPSAQPATRTQPSTSEAA